MERLIIADDNKSLALGLQKFFRKKGYETQTAHDGEELLELCREKGAKIDLLIVDLRMPRVDGLSAIRQIKETNPDIRFIVITGFGDSAHLEEATRLGVSDFLTKPFGLDEINNSVIKALNNESSL